MRAALRKPKQIEPKLLQSISLCFTIVKNAPNVMLPHSEAEETKFENFDFVVLLSSFFFFLHVPHMQLENHRAHMNVLHVKQMLYYWRGAFSGLELYASHDWRVAQTASQVQCTVGEIKALEFFPTLRDEAPVYARKWTVTGLLAKTCSWTGFGYFSITPKTKKLYSSSVRSYRGSYMNASLRRRSVVLVEVLYRIQGCRKHLITGAAGVGVV